MRTAVGAELPVRVTGNRGARLEQPVFGSAALRQRPLQPRPKAAWADLLPVELRSPEKARGVTRRFLGNCQAVSADTMDTAILIVSELVTNAYYAMAENANGILGIDLSLRWFNNQRLLMEVADSSPLAPVLAASGPDAVNGRGLSLVDELSYQWGFFWHCGRKIVYAVVSTADASNSASAWGQS